MPSCEQTTHAYHAAELFHLPARLFNEMLVTKLETRGIHVFNPQRDGFEFSQLWPLLAQELPPEDIDKLLPVLIYAYDIKSVWESDVVVARFDEPGDPGVDTEVQFAIQVGIPVVAYRTDSRSPYGATPDKFAGMHSFPVQEAAALIIKDSTASPTTDLEELAINIVRQIQSASHRSLPPEMRDIPDGCDALFEIIDILFDEVDVHTKAGVQEIIRRYLANKELIDSFGPKVIRA